MDGQSEKTIRVLEDMLRACVIDFGGHWNQFLPLVEFSYNNSYHLNIDMTPFEASYGRRCRSPIGWFDAFEVSPWGTDLLRESLDKLKLIQKKLLEAKTRKTSMRIGRFVIWNMVGDQKYYSDRSYIIYWDSVLFDQNLSFEEEPVAILDQQLDLSAMSAKAHHTVHSRMLLGEKARILEDEDDNTVDLIVANEEAGDEGESYARDDVDAEEDDEEDEEESDPSNGEDGDGTSGDE
ncbi:uncharacterized protein LOC132630583 [Lycium barbarum]|uniref:uncharacterized protein LOC132630583 n=1 Tax=Lycium barbarum TaxID=112863 RepID=UPI00293E6435|nr:uncharacterized protein LOC132630583 [Lycium barbarum]